MVLNFRVLKSRVSLPSSLFYLPIAGTAVAVTVNLSYLATVDLFKLQPYPNPISNLAL